MKRFLSLLILSLFSSSLAFAAQQIVESTDTLAEGATKINANDTELYNAITGLATSVQTATANVGTASTTTGLINFYNSSKVHPFGLFALGADSPGIGWRFPATLPAGTYLITSDTNGYLDYLDPSTIGGLSDAPSDGTLYGRLNGAWSAAQPYNVNNATNDSTTTFTNKTYDTAATGNNLVVPFNISIPWLNPADTDDPMIASEGRVRTLVGMMCVCLGGGTISVDLQECDMNGVNCAPVGANLTCGSTRTADMDLTDTSVASNAVLRLFVGAPSGTVSQILCQVWGTETL